MAMIDLRSARPEPSAQERAGYGVINGTDDAGPSPGNMAEPSSGSAAGKNTVPKFLRSLTPR